MAEFQSTLPRGERLSSINASDVGLVFQSTLPRGERLLVLEVPLVDRTFQSTLPRGERHDTYHADNNDTIISIHAPARGATPKYHSSV